MYFIIFFNIVSLRDKLIDLDPVVKPRGDKKRNPRNDKILKCVNKKNKSTVPSSPLWRGAAQRRGGQRIQECTTSLFPLVILGRGVPTTHTCHPGARGPHKNECFCGVYFDPRIQVIKLVAYATHHLHSEL